MMNTTDPDILQRLTEKVNTLQAMSELGKALTSTVDTKTLIRMILKHTSDILQPDAWYLLLKEAGQETYTYQIVINDPSIDRSNPVALGDGLAGWVAQVQTSVFAQAGQTPTCDETVPKFVQELIGQDSVMATPLISRDEVLGVIVLRRHKPETFQAEDLEVLKTISDFAAISIQNGQNFERISELTIRDDLTTLYNARYMHELLDQEVRRAKRYHKEFSMVFIDLDRFKEVNDTHGHVHGSALLKETSEVILKAARETDHCARYGGDEFVIVLPETNKKDAVDMAERLRQAIQDHVFLAHEGLSIRFTASFGVANFPDDAQSKQDLIKMADEAMYEVKRSSRNRVQGYDTSS
jgi:diguanylate cyclase (GGDEF)-like protein